MKANVVSFSGGRTSAYLVHCMEKMVKSGEIDNVHYVFIDTGAEHPKTYEFIRNCVDHFKIDLTCIRAVMTPSGDGNGVKFKELHINEIHDDLDPWRQMLECYSSPSAVTPYCTTLMKTEPYNAWIREKFGGQDNVVTWLGIRIDEPRRLKDKDGTKYLAEISPMDKQDIIGWWRDQPFDLEIESDHLGNCVFCVKKGTNKVALAARDEPELYERFRHMLNSTTIRRTKKQLERGIDARAIYRNATTIEQVVQSYADVDRDMIIARTRRTSGACSESCEVFNCQIDLFGGE